jgi:N-acetylmuramoyl-L-alanine amidase
VELSIPSLATWHLSPFLGDSVTLTIHGATVCSDEIDSLVPTRPIRKITARQVFTQSVVTLHLVDTNLAVRASQPHGSGLLKLSIEPPLDLVQEPPKEFAVRRILIDPGHGGDDVGAVSRDGVLEKDVTLSLALLTARTLRRRLKDVEVLLTREDDTAVRLVKRVEMANSLTADLFVSVHCNSSFNRSLRGFQAFFLSPSTTKTARAVAALENAVMALDEQDPASSSRESSFSLWDIVQNQWLSHSKQLAAALTEAASRRLDTEIHDATQASLFVLNGTTMPAVLLEVGYLSNPRDARKLRDSGFLEQIALALSEGIERFIEGLDVRGEPIE